MQTSELQNKIIRRLLSSSATPREIAEAVDTPEPVVLSALDEMRQTGLVEFMAGDWSLTGDFKAKIAGAASE